MWTLINRTKTMVSGIFPTYETAVLWALQHVADLDMTPIEIIVGIDTRTKLVLADGWTWSEQSITAPMRVSH